jgi:hypothetical protein
MVARFNHLLSATARDHQGIYFAKLYGGERFLFDFQPAAEFAS